MRDRALLASLLLSALPAVTAAQESVSAETQAQIALVKEKAEAFFGTFASPTPDAENAVRAIVGDGPLRDRTDDVKKLIEQAQSLDAKVGAFKGHDFATSRSIGSDLIFLRYLYKGERYPVVWYFTFYRTNGPGGLKRDWALISLRFDTKVEALDR